LASSKLPEVCWYALSQQKSVLDVLQACRDAVPEPRAGGLQTQQASTCLKDVQFKIMQGEALRLGPAPARSPYYMVWGKVAALPTAHLPDVYAGLCLS
jgi:hypothetical protein